MDEAAIALSGGDGQLAVAAAGRSAEAILASSPPGVLLEPVAAQFRSLAAQAVATGERALFAVRSSAAMEDGGTHSHAGQFESVLNVAGLADLWDAIRVVWASWYSERATHYRLRAAPEHGQGEGAGPPAMAVVVQRLVVPRASGILFTANPMTGSPREMTLEAGPGLGEALAQGRVRPDFARIRRHPLRIEQRSIAPRVGRLVPSPPGSSELRFIEPPQDAPVRSQACVSDEEILGIARLGLAVEEQLGGPVDLEWTVDGQGTLWLLQARPITALSDAPPASIEELRRRPVLWTQRFCGERWSDQATPLGWSVIQPVLHHFTLWEDARANWLDGTDPTRLYRGRPYFNLTIFRHLAFRMPGGSPPQLILEMLPEDEADVLRSAPPYGPNLALVGSIFSQVFRERRWARYRFNFLTNHAQWEAFEPVLAARTEGLPLDFPTAAEGMVAVDEGRALIVQYLELHLLSLLFAHLTYELLGKALRSWVGESGEALRSALVAESDNASLRVNRDLWDLAELARATPGLSERIEAAQGDPLAALSELPTAAPFLERLRGFLATHGHRSDASWEIFSDRWEDAPHTVLRMVLGVQRGGTDPLAHQRARDRDRAHAEELVRARFRRSRTRKVLPWRRVLFDQLLTLSRRYMALRENQRYAFDRLLLRLKRIFERQGELLAASGHLPRAELLPFLALDELRALASGPPDAALVAAAERRRAEFEAAKGAERPDFLLAGDQPLAQAAAPPGDHLQGLGISPGKVRGRVRVLHSLDDLGKLQAGDILVARATDPGWTPLFLTASGLVLELGSLLSHGAVVAREYRLPAVVNVPGATRVLEDDMDVTVDGDRGLVIVHRA